MTISPDRIWSSLSLATALILAGCAAQNGPAQAETQRAQSTQESPVSSQPSALSEAGLENRPLTIDSATGRHAFIVELAKTSAEQARGLMFRTELAPDRGMVFPFAEDRIASFWMKNTVIPLDIIFIRRDGTIESIAANTTPYSLAPVRSGEPVAAVLELAGGRAAELSLKAGDKVDWSR